MRVSGDLQIFRAALGDGFLEHVAPGVIHVAVAPVLTLVLQDFGRAVSARVLRRGQPVQRIVSERLVAIAVTIVVNSKDIPVVARAIMEIIANGIDGLAGSRGRHSEWLQALVVSECVGDSGKA